MSITLTPETQKLLDQLVQDGKFPSAEVAIQKGLALLAAEEQDRADALADLKAKLQRGVEQAERGEFVTAAEVFRVIEERNLRRTRNSA